MQFTPYATQITTYNVGNFKIIQEKGHFYSILFHNQHEIDDFLQKFTLTSGK